MALEVIRIENNQAVGSGTVAQRLLAANMDPMALRDNATLRKDEWEQLDTAVVEVARERLVAVQDLITAGLVFPVDNALGTLVVQHELASEMTAAEVTMDGVTRSRNDRVTFSLVSTPLPIIHHDFQITARHLAASRRMGQSMDVTQAGEASRQVSETMESLLFNGLTSGDTLGFGSSQAQLFGYTNRTNRNTVTLATDWDASAATGETILDDVLSMITAAQADRRYGPYMVYVPTEYWVPLMDDFKSNSDKTIFQRLSELPGIIAVKVADKLSANNVLLVEFTRANVDLVVGMQPTTISWETQGGMVMFFKVMAIMVPRIKLDSNNSSGVVHLS